MTTSRDIPKYSKRTTICRNPVFVDGLMRTGKYMVAPIVAGLNRSEMFQMFSIIDDIPIMYRMGHITEDALSAVLNREFDINFYGSLLGRLVNFRYNDLSSIYKSRDPSIYLQRVAMQQEYELLDGIENREEIFPLITHEMLCNARVMLRSCPNLRMVSMLRNPVDMAYSWWKKDWVNRFGRDPRSSIIAFESEGEPIPWYVSEWSDDYCSSNDIDRIVKCLAWLYEDMKREFDLLAEKDKGRLMFISYDNFISQTHENIERLCTFLDTEPSPAMPQILSRTRLPNPTKKNDFQNRIDEIKASASSHGFELLQQLHKKYEEDIQNGYWPGGPKALAAR